MTGEVFKRRNAAREASVYLPLSYTTTDANVHGLLGCLEYFNENYYRLRMVLNARPYMNSNDAEDSRPEIIAAAMIYLMTHDARTGYPRLALCISRHMQCLALHRDAPTVLRDMCASLHGTWSEAACVGVEGERRH
jgi:hypothetical protein